MGDPARRTGVLAHWNDVRGYGFVEPDGDARRLFVHVSAYPSGAGRPSEGDVLEFDLARDAAGRPQAVAVRVLASARRASAGAAAAPDRRRGPLEVLPLAVVPLFLVLFGLVIARWEAPLWGIVIYPAMSVATFLLYLADKRAALAGTWRVREATLLTAGLLGGWPGGIVAHQVLRHKTRKRRFLIAFWCLAVVNVVVFVGLVWFREPIAAFLQQF